MESISIENLNFTYPNSENKTLVDINLAVKQGEFVVVCGKSGCGKTTLLKMLKPTLTPFGKVDGNVCFNGIPVSNYNVRQQASNIGFVMQNPDNQIVTDKVWHELAFGLESLGFKQTEIRTRVSEMASFFGIQNWFHKNVNELSGGQKQLLNLASVMAMQPKVLILDEPTSQLDPIAATEFLKTLEKINRELGTTILLTEHRLEDAFPIADRVVVMDKGKIIADEVPAKVGQILKEKESYMYKALPTPVRVHSAVADRLDCPLTIREGRMWLEEYSKGYTLDFGAIPKDKEPYNSETVIEIKDAYFRYEKETSDVVKGFDLVIKKGELFCLVGGNGTGKSTALSLISGLNSPHRGKVLIKGNNISEIKNLYSGVLGVLPQNPQSLFVKKSVYLDLMDMLSEQELTLEGKEQKVQDIAVLCNIENHMDSHPYDLSGGEQQRVAIAKILLTEPEILLLDEPTKGMDSHFKEKFAEILQNLKSIGVTILMVSHDIEFCAEYADRCALMFDGSITSIDTPREFFKGKNFYTTSANRMARNTIPDAILAEDIILACGGKIEKNEKQAENIPYNQTEKETSAQNEAELEEIKIPKIAKKLTKRTLLATFLVLCLIPLTIYVGVSFFDNRKYYFISLLIILEIILPFCLVFESRKPQARELVILSVLCAIAVAGRGAFFMLPQFKPVIALIIISGISFGGETGFLVGAVTGFVSNFFFGQGPWTPWQMFALGIIGFLAGVIFRKGLLKKTKTSLCIFGFLTTLIIYGGIMNPASVVMWQNKITLEMLVSAYVVGLPFDLIHAFSTAFFLFFISKPMIEKLERIKIKYGLVER